MNKIEIPDPVKEKTTKCESNFKCLDDNSCMCEVIEGSKLTTVKIKPKLDLSCPYVLSVGSYRYCLCPTRNQIYKKYKQ